MFYCFFNNGCVRKLQMQFINKENRLHIKNIFYVHLSYLFSFLSGYFKMFNLINNLALILERGKTKFIYFTEG